MARRSRPLAAGAVAVSLLLLPATALGAATFQVRNERGVPQSHAKIMRGPHLVGYTDAYGFANAAAVSVGDHVRVTRDIANVGGCSAPEGPWGVEYQLRDARAVHTVTLPAVLRQTYQAGLDAEERALLRRINEQRDAAGLPSLVASSVLNRTADAYAGHLASIGRLGHCMLASPHVRAWDMGFPGDPIGESIGRAASADQMLDGWLASPAHRATILQANARSAGIGRIGRTWVAMLSGACLADRCGMTGDRGEDVPLTTDRGAGHTRAKPWLRVSR